MVGSEAEAGGALASEARSATRSALFLLFALAAEHPCGPSGWLLDRPAFRLAALVDLLYADGWRSLDELEDLDDDQLLPRGA